MSSPFDEGEKRFLLAEVIKSSDIDISTLVDFIKEHQSKFDFFGIQLPSGRNMKQCIEAAEQLFEVPIPESTLPISLKRKSPMQDAMPTRSPMVPIPDSRGGESSYHLPPLQTTIQQHANPILPSPIIPHSHHVPIQPRPTGSNGHHLPPPSPAYEQPAKRRRGRPPRNQQRQNLKPNLPQHLTSLAPHPLTGQKMPGGTPPRDLSIPRTPTPTSVHGHGNALIVDAGDPESGGGHGPTEPRLVADRALERFQELAPIRSQMAAPGSASGLEEVRTSGGRLVPASNSIATDILDPYPSVQELAGETLNSMKRAADPTLTT